MNQQTLPNVTTRAMKAIVSMVYGPTSVIRIEQVPRPTPGPTQVLVRNRASVVTTAMVEARAGRSLTPRLYFGLRKPKWPILGTNFSGHVEAVGAEVTRFRVGERVSGVNDTDFGAHAEFLLVEEDGVIAATPPNLSDQDAVAVFDGSMTALPFIRDAAQLRPGQSILVNGAAGAIGTAAVQLAKHYGATVTAVCSTANLDLVRRLRADTVIDRSLADFTTSRDAYDVIFDTVGKSSFLRSRASLKRGGRYLTTVPSLAILVQKLWTSRFSGKRAGILFTGLAKPAKMREDLLFMGTLAKSGGFTAVIGSVSTMEQAAEAYDLVDTGRKVGSAVVTIDSNEIGF